MTMKTPQSSRRRYVCGIEQIDAKQVIKDFKGLIDKVTAVSKHTHISVLCGRSSGWVGGSSHTRSASGAQCRKPMLQRWTTTSAASGMAPPAGNVPSPKERATGTNAGQTFFRLPSRLAGNVEQFQCPCLFCA